MLFTLLKGDSSWQDATVVVQDLTTGTRTVLVEHGTDARVIAAGYLIYERESTLFAIAFDEGRLAVCGSPVPVQSGRPGSAWQFFRRGAGGDFQQRFARLRSCRRGRQCRSRADVAGSERCDEQLKFPPAPHFAGRSQRLSPDGKRLASRITGSSSALSDIWVGEFEQGIFRRLTFDGRATDPVWSADGREICYENRMRCLPASRWQRFPAKAVQVAAAEHARRAFAGWPVD